MPALPFPDSMVPLVTEPVLASLATIGPDGAPEVNPVWFLWENGEVLISVKAETRKYQSMRANPRVAFSIVDPANGFHYLELRGEAIEFTEFRDLSFVNLLARKYTGADYSAAEDGKERYRVRIRIDRWTGQ